MCDNWLAWRLVLIVVLLYVSFLKFDSISTLSNSIFGIISLARFLRTDKNYKFWISFIKMLFNILKIKPIFGDFVIRYRFLMLFDAGLSIVRYRFWVHIRCRFDILKCRAALTHWSGSTTLFYIKSKHVDVWKMYFHSICNFSSIFYLMHIIHLLIRYIIV